GIAPQVAKGIMRHSDYRTTLKHYTRLSLCDAASAMEKLPGIPAPKPEQGAQKATGTDGVVSRRLSRTPSSDEIRGDSARHPTGTDGAENAVAASGAHSVWLGRQASNLRPGG